MKKIYLIAALLPVGWLQAQTPEITSWLLNTTGLTGYGGYSANVQQVQYSANYVYVSCSDIPAYSIGPWPMNPNTPTDQGFVFKIPRNPQPNTGNPTATSLGHIAVLTNGVTVFNAKDAMSYNNQNVWHQNAPVVEGPSMDACLGHPAPGGEYHHHQRPVCLYTANASQHSPIIGYAFDGYPIYGAYAYQNTNGTGPISRMRSSYRLRNITTRTTLPDGTVLSSGQYGPAVSTTYPLGYYIEDFEYISGLGDLDEYNGRFCVTPEYPSGTYCYYATIDSLGASAYPYMIGPNYYGIVTAGNTGPGGGHVTITETVTNYTPTTGLAAQMLNISFAIFPVPATDQLTVMLPASSSTGTIEVYDALGAMVYRSAVNEKQTIDVSSWSSGMYSVRLLSDKGTGTQRIVVQH